MALCRSTKIKEDKTTPSQIITDHFFSVALFLQGDMLKGGNILLEPKIFKNLQFFSRSEGKIHDKHCVPAAMQLL